MGVLELEPRKVFRYFQEISNIPHGSGNTEALEQYCLDFAKERGLEGYHDNYGNVMIFKEASSGYEEHEPVILQGHLDMVCEKTATCAMDMDQDALILATNGTKLWAEKTTLGADDGIAIAYILAILDSKNIKHPPIEALFTIDEEIGLLGAHHLDVSKLRGKKLINLDSEEEGILTVSCAGAARVECEIPISQIEAKECTMQIGISGLLGGHSGVDIHLERKNAGKLLGEVLDYVNQKTQFGIASITCGGRLNVIPQSAKAIICADGKDCAVIFSALQEYERILKKECENTEPNVTITVKSCDAQKMATDEAGTKQLIFSLLTMPNGVIARSQTIPDLVETSLNLGSVFYQDGCFETGFMIRSNSDYGKQNLKRQLFHLAHYMGGSCKVGSEYPAWEYRASSQLRDIMVTAYEDLYGQLPQIRAVHAGLECGIIAEKIPSLDLISFGPTMKNVHTPKEWLDVHSAKRCFHYLVHILERL